MGIMSLESAKSFYSVNCGGAYLFADIRLVRLQANLAYVFARQYPPLFAL